MFMRVHCDYCNQDYDVYERDSLTGKTVCQCPHCGSKIDRDIWLSTIVPAFKMSQVANTVLYRDHAENHKSLFTVSFIADHIFEK